MSVSCSERIQTKEEKKELFDFSRARDKCAIGFCAREKENEKRDCM